MNIVDLVAILEDMMEHRDKARILANSLETELNYLLSVSIDSNDLQTKDDILCTLNIDNKTLKNYRKEGLIDFTKIDGKFYYYDLCLYDLNTKNTLEDYS